MNRDAPVAFVLLMMLLVGGCGGGEPAADPAASVPAAPEPSEVTLSPGPDGVQAVTLVTQDNYRFVPARFVVDPGRVRVTVQNPSTTVHSLKFDPTEGGTQPQEQIPVVRPTEEASIEFVVGTPGEYRFVCTFHVQFNQRGTMVVR